MAKQEFANANGELTATADALKNLKEQYTAQLKEDMLAIRTSIHALTEGDFIDIKEPINFNSIIPWSGPRNGRNGVMLFLGGDYNEVDTLIRITSLSTREDGDDATESMNITVNPQIDANRRMLIISAGKSLKIDADEGKYMTAQVEAGKEDIDSSNGQDPASVFHRIDLATDAVRFTRQALLQEVRAIDIKARTRFKRSRP